MAWNPYFLLFGGCPPHKKIGASYGMKSWNLFLWVPVMAWNLYSLFLFGWYSPNWMPFLALLVFYFPLGVWVLKRRCQLWHEHHIGGSTPKKTIAMYGMEIISLFGVSPLTYLFVGGTKQTHLHIAPAQQLVKRCHCWQVEPLQAWAFLRL